jgi:NADPH2:quinone reductase
MMQKGIYPHPKGYPLVAGLELAGTVTSIGDQVKGLEIGNRVAGFSENAGAFAEYCVVPQERIIILPDDMSFETGAGFYIQAMTAWSLLHNVSVTEPGDILLIHAIGGGVGLALTQLAKSVGATVIGTVGTPGKESRALDYGADLVLNRMDEDFVQRTMEFTNGRGVDKVIDSTGASILDRSFDTIRPLGHVVSYGEAEGKPFENLWEQLVKKSLTFTRFHVGHTDYTSLQWRKSVHSVLAAISSEKLKVPIEGIYTLETAKEMFLALGSRKTAGKLILKIKD